MIDTGGATVSMLPILYAMVRLLWVNKLPAINQVLVWTCQRLASHAVLGISRIGVR